ncbi:class I SAM-dependent methyltransferase [Halalkalibacillus halophilus]|uniref:class I SAM-dependent methyltransferase n=1 Tax=Halalkalibacillus halophilus TaxID=392827 RepID=UPI000426658E|nr:class I SAM-dependent methyltransferase [Halalkalibacillus halophilus]
MNIKKWKDAYYAHKWMKKNEPFLSVWHVYVGYETELFKAFKKGKTVEKVSKEYNYEEDLVRRWVEVGEAIGHVKKKGSKYKTSKKNCGEFLDDRTSHAVGALLKEMMELHIPTILAYPDYIKKEGRAHFDHERFGKTVADTSATLENFAYKQVLKMISSRKDGVVVDLGCGTGGYTRAIAHKYPKATVIGVDLNKDVIEIAKAQSKQISNIQFENVDLADWSLEGEAVDVVLMHNLLHYIPNHEREATLQRIAGWLPSGGQISIMTPVTEAKFGEAFVNSFNAFFTAHDNLFSLPSQVEMQQLAKSADLKVKNIEPIIKEGAWHLIHLVKE